MTSPGPGEAVRRGVAVDANALDASEARADLVRRFLGMVADGVVDACLTPGIRAELDDDRTPPAVRDAVAGWPVAARQPVAHERTMTRIRVRAILRGDGPADRHEADAAHLCEAAEAGCGWFLTEDRRILRRRDPLCRVLPTLRIATLEAFVGQAFEPDEDEAW